MPPDPLGGMRLRAYPIMCKAAPIMLKFSWIMRCCTAQEMLDDFLIVLTLAQVLTQLHVSACASLSLRNRDMITEAGVGLVLPVVFSLRLLFSVFYLQHILFSAKPAIHGSV